MHNLIDDPAYADRKIDLRRALYRQLADRNGRHVIPYGMRQSIGSVRRNRMGTGAAQFPDKWLVEPNAPDRFDDIMPDSPAKLNAHQAGRPLVPSIPLRDDIRKNAEGK